MRNTKVPTITTVYEKMKYTTYSIILIFISHSSYYSTAFESGAVAFGKAPIWGYISWLHGLSFSKCREECEIRTSCSSVAYDRRTLSCSLNTLPPDDSDNYAAMMDIPGIVHARMQLGKDAQLPCGTCADGQACDLSEEQCVHKECTLLTTEGHRYIEGWSIYIGAKTAIYCNDNTYVNNSTELPAIASCIKDGTWSIVWPQCKTLDEICWNYLVSGPHGSIIAKSMDASSILAPFDEFSPYNGVLFNKGCWAPGTHDYPQYLQVEFYGKKLITGVVTQGRQGYQQWVTDYGLAYSLNCISYTDLKDVHGNIERFTGNDDTNSVRVNYLRNPVEALCIQLKPTGWYNRIALRLEFVGCDESDIAGYRKYQRG